MHIHEEFIHSDTLTPVFVLEAMSATRVNKVMTCIIQQDLHHLLPPNPTDSAACPSTRSVQSEADEVRGPPPGAPPGARPGAGGKRQVAHFQQVRVQRQSGGEEGHFG